MPYEYIATSDGLLTTPLGSPKILIHTRQGKVVGIYCDQPANVLVVETPDDPRRGRPPNHAFDDQPADEHQAGRRLAAPP